jgi:hypothetical protein
VTVPRNCPAPTEVLEWLVDYWLDADGYCDGEHAAATFRQIVRLDADGGWTIVRPYEPPRPSGAMPAPAMDIPVGGSWGSRCPTEILA